MSTSSSPALAATRVAAQDAASRSLIMLHGIYGRGRNWLGIARSLVAARPDYACWLVDLPHHGASGRGAHGETVGGLAGDLRDWMAAGKIEARAVLGHSYGGKVALAAASAMTRQPLQIWIIDSSPETRDPSGSAWTMLQLIRGLPARFESREAAAAAIVQGGYASGVAQWMTTNLVREEDAFVWRLDFDVMERLLIDFFETDLWKTVEAPAPLHDLHFLKASESSAISNQAVERLRSLAHPRVHLHVRDGGHWIHAESPDVVTTLLAEHLPET